MLKYYTRACNFYYGDHSTLMVNKKLALPLNGNDKISFDTIELITRKKKKKIHISKLNFLSKILKKKVKLYIKNITKKKNFSTLKFKSLPLIMGVVNLTPDSFSDGGKYNNKNSGVAHAKKLYQQGCKILDIGGESTRPGSKEVKENIEWESTYHWRVRPVFEMHSGLWTQISTFITGPSLSSATVEILQDCCHSDGITVFGAFFNYFSAAIDKNGLEIWNSGPENFVYYSTDDYGNLFGCNLMGGSENNLPGLERTFQGEILWEEPNDEFLHHDLIRLPNGNYLGIVESNSMGPIPIGPWSQSFQGLGFQADGTSIEFPWVGDKLVEWDRETTVSYTHLTLPTNREV